MSIFKKVILSLGILLGLILVSSWAVAYLLLPPSASHRWIVSLVLVFIYLLIALIALGLPLIIGLIIALTTGTAGGFLGYSLLKRAGFQCHPGIDFFYSFSGRITRTRWWFFNIPVFFLMLWLSRFMPLAVFVLLIPFLAVSVKRFHDLNRSAWWVLIAFIPLIGNIAQLIFCGFIRGSIGENRFGPDPLEGK
jgi:hypothetical protein